MKRRGARPKPPYSRPTSYRFWDANYPPNDENRANAGFQNDQRLTALRARCKKCLSMPSKTRRAPSPRCRDTSIYGHTTACMNMRTPPAHTHPCSMPRLTTDIGKLKRVPHFFVSRSSACQGYTALLVACQSGNVELANFLVSQGAALGAITARGMSALHLAAEMGTAGLIRMLCDAGVSACEYRLVPGMCV